MPALVNGAPQMINCCWLDSLLRLYGKNSIWVFGTFNLIFQLCMNLSIAEIACWSQRTTVYPRFAAARIAVSSAYRADNTFLGKMQVCNVKVEKSRHQDWSLRQPWYDAPGAGLTRYLCVLGMNDFCSMHRWFSSGETGNRICAFCITARRATPCQMPFRHLTWPSLPYVFFDPQQLVNCGVPCLEPKLLLVN